MKPLALLLVSLAIACGLNAQKPVFEKPKIKPGDQKTIDPGPVRPYVAPVSKVAFSSKITRSRQVLVGDKLNNFDQTLFNDANGFDAATGVFTTPAAGYYSFMLNATIPNYSCNGDPVSLRIYVSKNNTNLETFELPVQYGNGYTSQGFSMFTQLQKGDKIAMSFHAIACLTGGESPSIDKVIFSGYKID